MTLPMKLFSSTKSVMTMLMPRPSSLQIEPYDIADEVVFLHKVGDDDVDAAFADLLVLDPVGDRSAHRKRQLLPQRRRHTPDDVVGCRSQYALGYPKPIIDGIVADLVIHVEFLNGLGYAVGVGPRRDDVVPEMVIATVAVVGLVDQDNPLFSLPQVGQSELIEVSDSSELLSESAQYG